MQGIKEIIDATLVLVASESVKEATKSIVSVYVKPKLEKLHKNTKEKNDLDLIEYKFNDYLERSYEKYLYMNTIAFKNGQKTMNHLYIPLTVKKSNSVNDKKEVEIFIDKYRDDFIPEYKKILLVDNAGMGKSTIMKYLFLSAVTEKKGIPILIELRKIEKDVTLVDFIMNEINGIKEKFEKDSILALIERGDFIFLFDGYDEIKDELKESVTKNLEDFIDKSSKNEFIISSREESSLSCFGDFQRFDIKPLSTEEAYRLIEKYDDFGELSKQLIDMLENEENLKIVREFLENPLMVSLLYLAFGYRRDLPNGKHIFYEQVYYALFLDHDKSKGGAYVHPKRSNLNIDEFHKVLRTLGFITLKQGVSYTRETLIDSLQRVKKKVLEINFNECDFIYDLEHIVPLFTKEGNEYRWCHKSFQEYFAASYICSDAKEKQHQLLAIISNEDNKYKYYNVLDFCYDIDYKQFAKAIIYPILQDLKEFYDNRYCNKYFSDFNQEDVDLRKQLEFSFKDILIKKVSKRERDRLTKNEDEIFDNFFEDWENNRKSCSIINNIIGVVYGSTRIQTLLRLFYSKQSNIVKEIHIESGPKIDNLIINKINIGKYEINDCVENKVNNKNIFSLINYFILDNSTNSTNKVPLIFDYVKCMELKRKIEEDIQEEKNDLDFI